MPLAKGKSKAAAIAYSVQRKDALDSVRKLKTLLGKMKR